MNIWANAVITEKGLALQAKLIEGTTLNITRAVTATGYVTPGLLMKQTDVTNPMQELTFRPVTYPEEGKCSVPMVLDNKGLTTGYTALQVGIYATDPDEGEILYFIAQAVDQNHGTVVPAESELDFNAEWTFYFQYGQADEVTVIVDPAGAISRKEMETYINSEFIRITYAEIDLLAGFAGGDTSGGTGSGGESGGTGGVYTLDHSMLYNRDAEDQHPIESITGLEEALATAEGDDVETTDIAAAWENA